MPAASVATPTVTNGLRRWIWAHPPGHRLLLALLSAVVFSNTVHDGYVAYDTPWLVVDNPLLRDGDFRNLPGILLGMDTGTRLTLGAEYLPVRDASVLVDFALFGSDWAWHHGQNLFWYALSCVLFLVVLGDLFGARLRTFLGAALYAVHPVHVESVGWLASRKDVLSLAMFMASLVFWQRRERWRGASVSPSWPSPSPTGRRTPQSCCPPSSSCTPSSRRDTAPGRGRWSGTCCPSG